MVFIVLCLNYVSDLIQCRPCTANVTCLQVWANQRLTFYIHLLVGDLLLKPDLCFVIQQIKLQKLITNKNNGVHVPIFLLSVFDLFLIFSSPFLICIHFDAHQFVSLLLLFLQFSGSFGACTILFDLLPFELYFWCCFSCSVKKKYFCPSSLYSFDLTPSS